MSATYFIRSVRTFATVLALLAILISCQKAPTKAERIPEPYTPIPSAVKFDILPAGGSGGSRSWIASYTDGDRATRFRLELGPQTAVQDRADMLSGMGTFTSEPNSDPTVLLSSLKTALQAKNVPTKVMHADTLPFTYMVLGDNQKRRSDGTFGEESGNWTVMKISLGKGEVFLNINPVDAVAEFSMKDPKYGNAIVSELAKVF